MKEVQKKTTFINQFLALEQCYLLLFGTIYFSLVTLSYFVGRATKKAPFFERGLFEYYTFNFDIM